MDTAAELMCGVAVVAAVGNTGPRATGVGRRGVGIDGFRAGAWAERSEISLDDAAKIVGVCSLAWTDWRPAAFLVEAFAILAASLSAIANRAQATRPKREVPQAVVSVPNPAVAPIEALAPQRDEVQIATVAALPVKPLQTDVGGSSHRSTPMERQILSALAKAPGRRLEGSQRAIAAFCSVPKSTFSVAVKRLVAAGALSVDARGVAMAV